MTSESEPTTGDLSLTPGRYRFWQRVEREGHFVDLTQWTAQTSYGPVGLVRPRRSPARSTAAEKEGKRRPSTGP